MRVFKPAWIDHSSDAIYSVDVQPGNLRFSTTGADGTLKIWSTAPLFSEELESDETLRQPLCVISRTDLTARLARWSNCGRFLAVGTSEGSLLIYHEVPSKARSTIGSRNDKNIENWMILTILTPHRSIINDITWSPCDAYLASASVDGSIAVYSTSSFLELEKKKFEMKSQSIKDSSVSSKKAKLVEPIHVLKGHNNWVQGLSWDPFNRSLVSCGNENSVILWKADDYISNVLRGIFPSHLSSKTPPAGKTRESESKEMVLLESLVQTGSLDPSDIPKYKETIQQLANLGNSDPVAPFWRVSRNKKSFKGSKYSTDIRRISFSADGASVATTHAYQAVPVELVPPDSNFTEGDRRFFFTSPLLHRDSLQPISHLSGHHRFTQSIKSAPFLISSVKCKYNESVSSSSVGTNIDTKGEKKNEEISIDTKVFVAVGAMDGSLSIWDSQHSYTDKSNNFTDTLREENVDNSSPINIGSHLQRPFMLLSHLFSQSVSDVAWGSTPNPVLLGISRARTLSQEITSLENMQKTNESSQDSQQSVLDQQRKISELRQFLFCNNEKLPETDGSSHSFSTPKLMDGVQLSIPLLDIYNASLPLIPCSSSVNDLNLNYGAMRAPSRVDDPINSLLKPLFSNSTATRPNDPLATLRDKEAASGAAVSVPFILATSLDGTVACVLLEEVERFSEYSYERGSLKKTSNSIGGSADNSTLNIDNLSIKTTNCTSENFISNLAKMRQRFQTNISEHTSTVEGNASKPAVDDQEMEKKEENVQFEPQLDESTSSLKSVDNSKTNLKNTMFLRVSTAGEALRHLTSLYRVDASSVSWKGILESLAVYVQRKMALANMLSMHPNLLADSPHQHVNTRNRDPKKEKGDDASIYSFPSSPMVLSPVDAVDIFIYLMRRQMIYGAFLEKPGSFVVPETNINENSQSTRFEQFLPLEFVPDIPLPLASRPNPSKPTQAHLSPASDRIRTMTILRALQMQRFPSSQNGKNSRVPEATNAVSSISSALSGASDATAKPAETPTSANNVENPPLDDKLEERLRAITPNAATTNVSEDSVVASTENISSITTNKLVERKDGKKRRAVLMSVDDDDAQVNWSTLIVSSPLSSSKSSVSLTSNDKEASVSITDAYLLGLYNNYLKYFPYSISNSLYATARTPRPPSHKQDELVNLDYRMTTFGLQSLEESLLLSRSIMKSIDTFRSTSRTHMSTSGDRKSGKKEKNKKERKDKKRKRYSDSDDDRSDSPKKRKY